MLISWASCSRLLYSSALIPKLAASGENEEKLAESIFLQILGRLPSEAEKAEVAGYLKERSGDRRGAIHDLAWAMLTSTEFVVNH